MPSQSHSIFDELISALALEFSQGGMLDDAMNLNPRLVHNIPLRYRLIAQGFITHSSLENLNARLTSHGFRALYSRNLWEACLIYAFQNRLTYGEWKKLSEESAEIAGRASEHDDFFSASSITLLDLKNYVEKNSSMEDNEMLTLHMTRLLEKEILQSTTKKDFQTFIRVNIHSFTRVREKTRYYFCKYLYNDLSSRISRYFQAKQRGYGITQSLEDLAVFRSLSKIKRKSYTPGEALKILEESPISLREIFDSFNYFYFGYCSLDWMMILLETCDNPAELPDREKKAFASSARHYFPDLSSLSDDQVIAQVKRIAEQEQIELDQIYSLDSDLRGYQKGRGGENTLRKYIKGQLDPDRITFLAFLVFFGQESDLPADQKITEERLSLILSECGFAPLNRTVPFDSFLIGFLSARYPADYLMEAVETYAHKEQNFFLYQTWLNSDSEYDRLAKLIRQTELQ